MKISPQLRHLLLLTCLSDDAAFSVHYFECVGSSPQCSLLMLGQAPVVQPPQQAPQVASPAAGVPATTAARPVGRGLAALQALASQTR